MQLTIISALASRQAICTRMASRYDAKFAKSGDSENYFSRSSIMMAYCCFGKEDFRLTTVVS